MKQLLEAGVHFGHPTRKWNPKMKKYIYTSRNDIYIINLEKTVGLIDEAYAFIKSVAESGKNILFVGTKKQAQEAIQQEAEKCGMYYVKSRWLGGTLTNFSTIRTRIERLNKLNQMEKMNEFMKGKMTSLPKMKIKSMGKFLKFMAVLLKMSSLLSIATPPEDDEELSLLLCKLYFYLLSSGISQLNKMGHPQVHDWALKSPDRCYQWAVEGHPECTAYMLSLIHI